MFFLELILMVLALKSFGLISVSGKSSRHWELYSKTIPVIIWTCRSWNHLENIWNSCMNAKSDCERGAGGCDDTVTETQWNQCDMWVRTSTLSESRLLLPPFMHGIRMTCHACRKCNLLECAAEDVSHTWQQELKIVQKPPVHDLSIHALMWTPELSRSRFHRCISSLSSHHPLFCSSFFSASGFHQQQTQQECELQSSHSTWSFPGSPSSSEVMYWLGPCLKVFVLSCLFVHLIISCTDEKHIVLVVFGFKWLEHQIRGCKKKKELERNFSW